MQSVGLMHSKSFQLHIYVTSVPTPPERAKAAAALRAEMQIAELSQMQGEWGGKGGASATASPVVSRTPSLSMTASPPGRGRSGDSACGWSGGSDESTMSPLVTSHTGQLTAADYALALEMTDPVLSSKAQAAKWSVRPPGSVEGGMEAGEVGGRGSQSTVRVYSGRPDWLNMLASLAYLHGEESSAGVMFCGPPHIGSELRSECWRRNVRMGKLHFKLFSENF